ncbi:MAG: pyrimidine 5'-nucleotidase [Alphaproteobacteria bacterium]|nr:pyrimidine 5'-nucleotidase [Alphaproteobacteria bacterium]MDP6516606.1 pyrimidine 5'-nucleotidase [Alphaproteobacteria bacterium]
MLQAPARWATLAAMRARSRPSPPLTERIDTWIFDLDNTLYPARSNLFAQIDRRMSEYIAGLLGLGYDAARRLQKQYYRRHGTTLNGLMVNHGIEPKDYLEYVHDIDLTPLSPAPDLDRALARLPGRKLVFTNGSNAHAERVMNRLGVRDRFDAVYDIEAAQFRPKPLPETYARFVDRHGVESRRAVMFEDSAANLEPAAALGMITVWVREGDAEGTDRAPVDHVTADLVSWLAALRPG